MQLPANSLIVSSSLKSDFFFFFFKRDFEELAKQNEQNCRDLYRYFQEASSLWDVHQLELSKQEGELQKKLDECRQKQNKLIQV